MNINSDLKVNGTSQSLAAIADSAAKHLSYTYSGTNFDTGLVIFRRNYVASDSLGAGTYLFDCMIASEKASALVQKYTNTFFSIIFLSYRYVVIMRTWGGTEMPDIPLMELSVERNYLGENPDINSLHYRAGVYGMYNCSQAPNTAIGVLEVLPYSGDWCAQRFTDFDAGQQRIWERSFLSGTTWTSWRLITDSSTGWTNLTYYNNYSSYDEINFNRLSYKRVGKQVFLRGIINCPTANPSGYYAACGELPVGCRPSKGIVLPLARQGVADSSGNAYADVAVYTDGTIRVTPTVATWVSLDGLSFWID